MLRRILVFLSALKFYENVGTFNVTVNDALKNTTAPIRTFDYQWENRISIPQDIQLTPDNEKETGCTGKCNATITTNPKLLGRGKINRVKILSLSVRKCKSGEWDKRLRGFTVVFTKLSLHLQVVIPLLGGCSTIRLEKSGP